MTAAKVTFLLALASWLLSGTMAVIARFASHPLAGNVNFDPTSLPAYRAAADHLIRHSR